MKVEERDRAPGLEAPAQGLRRLKTRCHDDLVLFADDRNSIVTGKLINLGRIRKRAAREKAASDAEQNRARFGRTKAQKDFDNQQAARAERKLDQHRLDDGKRS